MSATVRDFCPLPFTARPSFQPMAMRMTHSLTQLTNGADRTAPAEAGLRNNADAPTNTPARAPSSLTEGDIDAIVDRVRRNVFDAVERVKDRNHAEVNAAMMANLNGEGPCLDELYAWASHLFFEIEDRKRKLDDAIARMSALMDELEGEEATTEGDAHAR